MVVLQAIEILEDTEYVKIKTLYVYTYITFPLQCLNKPFLLIYFLNALMRLYLMYVFKFICKPFFHVSVQKFDFSSKITVSTLVNSNYVNEIN